MGKAWAWTVFYRTEKAGKAWDWKAVFHRTEKVGKAWARRVFRKREKVRKAWAWTEFHRTEEGWLPWDWTVIHRREIKDKMKLDSIPQERDQRQNETGQYSAGERSKTK